MKPLQSQHFIYSFPRLIKNPKQILSDQRLLADAVPLLTFLEPVGPLIISPIIVDLESRKKKADPQERKDNVFQEFIDQLTTVTVHFFSFLLGGYIAKRALPALKPHHFKVGTPALENGQTVVSILTTILGVTFVRPFIDTKLVTEKENAAKPGTTKATWAISQTSASIPNRTTVTSNFSQ
jgi:hypothetical protein